MPEKGRVLTEEDIVSEYFKLITNKDIDGLLNLFAHDAVIYEPFSNVEGGLRGRSAIEPFLRVVLMANENLQPEIVIEKRESNKNKVTALVTFEKGDKVTGRFTFEFDSGNISEPDKKIKTLRIHFI